MGSPALAAELAALADDPRPDVRLGSLATWRPPATGRAAPSRGRGPRGRRPTRSRRAPAGGPGDGRARAAIGRRPRRCWRMPTNGSGAAPSMRSRPAMGSRWSRRCAALADARTAAAAGGRARPARRCRRARRSRSGSTRRGARRRHASCASFVRSAADAGARRGAARHVGHPDRDLGLVVMERLVGPEPAGDETGAVLDRALEDDVALPRGSSRRCEAIGAGRRRGRTRSRGRSATSSTSSGSESPRTASPATGRSRWGRRWSRCGRRAGDRPWRRRRWASCCAPTRRAGPRDPRTRPGACGPAAAARAARGGGRRSSTRCCATSSRIAMGRGEPWLRACAIHAAIARGRLDGMDLGTARALEDPVIDELLASTSG